MEYNIICNAVFTISFHQHVQCHRAGPRAATVAQTSNACSFRGLNTNNHVHHVASSQLCFSIDSSLQQYFHICMIAAKLFGVFLSIHVFSEYMTPNSSSEQITEPGLHLRTSPCFIHGALLSLLHPQELSLLLLIREDNLWIRQCNFLIRYILLLKVVIG